MHTTRRTLLMLGVIASAVISGPAFAAEPQPYTDAAFDAAQKAGKPILVDTFATWCDICKRQEPIIKKLVEEPKFKDLVTFRVDFDRQKDIMRKFMARQQSTLIAFRGTKEVGRSIGDTQEEWIEDLMDKTVEKEPGAPS